MHTHIIQQLEHNGEVFKALFSGVPEEMYRWKPAPEKWRLLEILCHLYDEEREDFGARLRSVLEHPEQPLPAINPVGWVVERQYASQNYEQKLAQFLAARQDSVKWLRSLVAPQWDNAYLQPKFGPMSARLFLSNWLAHDYLHFRQITRLKYQYLQQLSGEDLSYAGDW